MAKACRMQVMNSKMLQVGFILGDVNIDVMPRHKNIPFTRQYLDMLSPLNLHQHVTKPTRTTKNSFTLTDHIISNSPERIAFTDIPPCPLLSDQFTQLIHSVYLCKHESYTISTKV